MRKAGKLCRPRLAVEPAHTDQGPELLRVLRHDALITSLAGRCDDDITVILARIPADRTG